MFQATDGLYCPALPCYSTHGLPFPPQHHSVTESLRTGNYTAVRRPPSHASPQAGSLLQRGLNRVDHPLAQPASRDHQTQAAAGLFGTDLGAGWDHQSLAVAQRFAAPAWAPRGAQLHSCWVGRKPTA